MEVLGDDYISQHITQGFREYLEQTSYKVYMTNMAKNVVGMLSGKEIESSWSDFLHELDGNTTPEEQAETEQEIKTRFMAKLNGKGAE